MDQNKLDKANWSYLQNLEKALVMQSRKNLLEQLNKQLELYDEFYENIFIYFQKFESYEDIVDDILVINEQILNEENESKEILKSILKPKLEYSDTINKIKQLEVLYDEKSKSINQVIKECDSAKKNYEDRQKFRISSYRNLLELASSYMKYTGIHITSAVENPTLFTVYFFDNGEVEFSTENALGFIKLEYVESTQIWNVLHIEADVPNKHRYIRPHEQCEITSLMCLVRNTLISRKEV